MSETTKDPISLIGRRAGVCWGADISDPEKNYKRGLDCLESNHGRTLEYPNIEVIIDGYSARTMREWYTHIGCLPSRLQASTRYIDYNNFDYVVPHSVQNNDKALSTYNEIMRHISDACNQLEADGVPREDIALILPLGMQTRVVDKRNLRNVIDMSHQRMCSRAYWEYCELFNNYCAALKGYAKEWELVVDKYLHPKCVMLGYCPEKRGCGKYPKRK